MGFLSGINKAVGGIVGGMQLPGGVGSVLSRALMGAPIDQRQAFVSVLLATVAHVNQKKNFNLELEINDLWIRLSNVRQASASSGLGGGLSGALSGISNLLNGNGLNAGLVKSLQAVLEQQKK